MHDVKLSSATKVLFPADGITKAELAEHYAVVGEAMVRQIRDRPVSLQVYPGGIGRPGHFMKSIPDYFPDWVDRVEVPKRGGTVVHPLANEPAALQQFAQHNAITPHVWTSRADRPDRPDRLVVDLDPDEHDTWADVVAGAHIARELLEGAGLTAFTMTTGSRGAHVVAPLRRESDFEAVRSLAGLLGDRIVEAAPDRFTTEFHKDKREGRLYIDVLRNRPAQTVVAPYALRAIDGAPMATPLRWDELEGTGPRDHSIRDAAARVADDPWADLQAAAASPRSAARSLGG